MALNRKIREETPNSIKDLLRETRTGTVSSPSVAQSANPVSAVQRQWNNFGTGEDPLMRKVTLYNQQAQTGRSPLASHAQQAQQMQKLGLDVTPAQARSNVRNTFGIGREPIQWESLTNEQRAALNTMDPQHRLYNVRSSTNFSPANQDLQLLVDSEGKPTIRRGVLSGGREAQRQMDARDQRLLEKLRSGAYETETPEQQQEMAGANQRAFARTPEYRSAMMQLAAAGGSNMTPEQQREFMSQRLQPKAERWAKGLVGQRPMSQEEYEQAQSSLDNRTKTALEHTGGLEGEAQRTIQDYMKELEGYDPLNQAKDAAIGIWYKATAAGVDVGGLTIDEINAMESPEEILDAITNRVQGRWYDWANENNESVPLLNDVQTVEGKMNSMDIDEKTPGIQRRAESAWVDVNNPDYGGGVNKEWWALKNAVKGERTGVQDYVKRLSNSIRQSYMSGEIQGFVREIENLMETGQGYTASQYYGSVMHGLENKKEILEAALRDDPKNRDAKDALEKLNKEIKTWETAGVAFNDDFQENSGYKTRYYVDHELFELNKIINSDYTETWWNTNKLNDHRWDLYMSPVQRATWNYLYNSDEYGPKDAKEYFDGIKNDILRTRAGAWQQDIEEKTNQNLATQIAAGAFSISALPFRATSGLVGEIMGQNPNDDAFAISNTAQTARQTVRNDIVEATKDSPILQGAATVAFDALMQAGDSLVGTAFGGLFSNMAGFAAGSWQSHAMSLLFQPADAQQLSYQKYKRDGMREDEAQLLATVAGGMEFGTEMLGMEWALKGMHSSKHPLMCAMARASFAEALEEFPGNLTMLIMENTLLGCESEINRDIDQRVYEMRGQINEKTGKPYTEDEARALATTQAYCEWGLNTLYEMGVAGLSAGPHTALQVSIDKAGYNRMVNDHLEKGDITQEQANDMKAAYSNAWDAQNGNDESMLDQDLQERAKQAQTEMYRNEYNREAAENPQAQQVAENITDISSRTFAQIGMLQGEETNTDAEAAAAEDVSAELAAAREEKAALEAQMAQEAAAREEHAPAESAETVDNPMKNNSSAKADAAAAAQQAAADARAAANKRMNDSSRLRAQIEAGQAQLAELENMRDVAMQKYGGTRILKQGESVLLNYQGKSVDQLNGEINNLHHNLGLLDQQYQERLAEDQAAEQAAQEAERAAQEAEAEARAEHAGAESAEAVENVFKNNTQGKADAAAAEAPQTVERPVQMGTQPETQQLPTREETEQTAPRRGVLGYEQFNRFKNRNEARDSLNKEIDQIDQEIIETRHNLADRKKDLRRAKRTKNQTYIDAHQNAVTMLELNLDNLTHRSMNLRQMAGMLMNVPAEAFNGESNREAAPTLQAGDTITEENRHAGMATPEMAQESNVDRGIQAPTTERLNDENNPVAEMRQQKPNLQAEQTTETTEDVTESEKPVQTVEDATQVEEQVVEELKDEAAAETNEQKRDRLDRRIKELEARLEQGKTETTTRTAPLKGRSLKDVTITEEEYAKYLKDKAGIIILSPQEREELSEKAKTLEYFFERNAFGAPVRVKGMGENTVIDGFAKSGKDAIVNVKTQDEDGKTVEKQVPLSEVDFGDKIGVREAYEHAAAYTDTDTARNYIAGFSATKADIYNYADAFDGLYAQTLNNTPMTEKQRVAAAMVEPAIKEMIRKAATKVKSQTAEALGFTGETEADIQKAEQAIADANSEQAKSKGYTGVVRDFSTHLTAWQRANMNALHWVAKNAGMKITLTDHIRSHLNQKNSIDENAGLNGFYRMGTNEAVIDIRAMKGATVVTAFHEAWHFVKNEAKHNAQVKEQTDAIEAKLTEHLNSLPNYNMDERIQEVIARYKEAGKTLTEEQAKEEIFADALMGVADRGLITQYAKANGVDTSGVLDRIRNVLKTWMQHLNKAITQVGRSSQEARIIQEAQEDLKTYLSNSFRITRETAGRAYAERMKGVETVEDEGERYSITDKNGSTEYAKVEEQPGTKTREDLHNAMKESIHPVGEQFSIMQFAEANGLNVRVNELGDAYEVVDNNGKPITRVTPDMIDDTPMGMLIDSALANKTIDEKKAEKERKMVADLMNLCIKHKDQAMVWEIAGSQLFSAMKGNSDAQYGTTIDFGTICAKTQAIIDVMSETMLKKGRGLTRNEIIRVYNETNKVGLSVPCPVCYVFSRWMGVPSLLDSMRRFQIRFENATDSEINSYLKRIENKYYDPTKMDKDGKALSIAKQINERKTKIQNKLQSLSEQMQKANKRHETGRLNELAENERQLSDELQDLECYNWVTQVLVQTNKSGKAIRDAQGRVKRDTKYKAVPNEILLDMRRTGEFAAEYAKSWRYRNTRGAGMGKAIMPYSGASIGDSVHGTERWAANQNPFLMMQDTKAKKAVAAAIKRMKQQNLIGGQRLQSTSDFRPEWGIDYLMTFLELQAIGAKGQMYTKVIEAVDMFASAGIEVNLSIMGKGRGYSYDRNGKPVLTENDFSSVTGIDYVKARDKVRKYDNVQMILVGLNDTHVRLAIESKDIAFVIPWHSSGSNAHILGQLMGAVGEHLENGTDYTDVQTDKIDTSNPFWQLRMQILTGKLKNGLTDNQRELLRQNEWLQDLYRRFYEDESETDTYHVWLKKDQAGQIFPYEYWDTSLTVKEADKNGRRFKEYCRSMGVTPRFSGAEKDGVEYGNFLNDKGYWKLLIDRCMYNNDGTYHVVKPIDATNVKIGQVPMSASSARYGDRAKTNQAVENALNDIMAMENRAYDLRAEESTAEEEENLNDVMLSLSPSEDVEDAADEIRARFGERSEDWTANPEMQRLQKENKQMHELVNQITAQMAEWRGENAVDEKQIARMARMLRKELETIMPFEDLKHDLTVAFDAMAKAKNAKESKAAIQALSDTVLDAVKMSNHADKTMYEEYKDARDIIKAIKFSRQDYGMINDAVGDRQSFQNKYFGRIQGTTTKLAESSFRNAYSVEDAWSELHAKYGNMFPDDIQNPADQLARMLAFLDETEIQYYNPYTEQNPENMGENRIDYTASDYTMRLLQEFMTNGREISGRNSARMANITRLMNDTQQEIIKQRELADRGQGAWAKRYQDQIKKLRSELQTSNFKEREARRALNRSEGRAAQLERDVKAANERTSRAYREGQEALENALGYAPRQKIVREINRKRDSLMKKFERPSLNSGWIPISMQEAVKKLLVAMDYENEITPKEAFTPELLTQAKEAYESINKEKGPEGARGPMASYYNGDLANTFDELIESRQKKSKKFTDEELRMVRDIVAGFSAAVINADRMFTQARSQTVHDNGDTMIQQSLDRIKENGEHKVHGKIVDWLSSALSRGLIKPTTAYGEYEGTVLGDIWHNLRKSERQHIRNVEAASEFFQGLIKKYKMQNIVNQESTQEKDRHRDRVRKHSHEFTIPDVNGDMVKVRLTTQELMTLYAWQKREEIMGTNHLLGGGFTLKNQAKGGTTAEYRPTPANLAEFNAALTDDQKAFVDEMVKYLSTTVGEWGNEVTRELYGIEKFTEGYYLPFTVNKNYVGQDPAQAQDQRIKVASFTKSLTKNASTTLELSPFMQLWAAHVEQMSDFNAFTLPIEDMVRLMNYRQSVYNEKGEFVGYGKSARPVMQRAWGKNSTDYIYSFLARLNGNSRMEHGGGWINRFMGSAKGAAVTFNLSVAFQQAGAGIRAMAEMNPVDVIRGQVKGLNVFAINKQYDELCKYAPIAIEKGWGYFDTNMKNGLYDRQRSTFGTKLDEWGGKMAEYGDKFNWVQIWQACKTEARRKNKGADAETIKQLAAERFEEVIDKTQVVDSVFQRAEWATEKGMMKYVLPFMSEPITMYNMLYRSVTELGRSLKSKTGRAKAFKKLGKNVMAIAFSGALTAILKSAITGLRDRDNEKKDKDGNIIGRRHYTDKVTESFWGNYLDNALGVGTVFTSVIQDAIGSYRSSGGLTDAWVGNFVDAGKELLKGDECDWDKFTYKALQGISALNGVGFSSLYRDTKSIIMTCKEEFSDSVIAADAYDRSLPLEKRVDVAKQSFAYTKQYKGDGMKVKSSFWTDLLLETYMQYGLGEEYEMVADAAISVGATQDGLESSFKSKVRAADERVPGAAKALVDGDMDKYNQLVHELMDAGIGTLTINSMVTSEYKKLIDDGKPANPGTGKQLIMNIQAEDENGSALSIKAKGLLSMDATEEDVKEAIDLYRQDGVKDEDIDNKFSTQYRKPYIEARRAEDEEEIKRLEGILLTEGTGIDRKTLDDWVKDGYNDQATELLTDKATTSDVSKAISILQKGGYTQKEIKQKISDKYKKAYVQACVAGKTSEAARLQKLCLTNGTGITAADVKEWTGNDLFGTQKDTGLYWQIMNGKTADAKATCQWLYKNYAGGQQAVKDKVLKWAKTRKKNGTETDWQTVKTVLLALGFSAATIKSAIGI